MKKFALTALLLSGSLLLPEMALAQPGGDTAAPLELTSGALIKGNWKHTGDLSFSSQQGTAEDVLAEIRIRASRKGAFAYRVTSLQLLNNGGWRVSAATYAPIEPR